MTRKTQTDLYYIKIETCCVVAIRLYIVPIVLSFNLNVIWEQMRNNLTKKRFLETLQVRFQVG